MYYWLNPCTLLVDFLKIQLTFSWMIKSLTTVSPSRPDLGFSALSAMFRVFCSAHVALGFVIHHRSNSVLDLKGPNRSTFDKNSVSDWIKRNVHLEPQF